MALPRNLLTTVASSCGSDVVDVEQDERCGDDGPDPPWINGDVAQRSDGHLQQGVAAFADSPQAVVGTRNALLRGLRCLGERGFAPAHRPLTHLAASHPAPQPLPAATHHTSQAVAAALGRSAQTVLLDQLQTKACNFVIAIRKERILSQWITRYRRHIMIVYVRIRCTDLPRLGIRIEHVLQRRPRPRAPWGSHAGVAGND
jgi:hypothetical protein